MKKMTYFDIKRGKVKSNSLPKRSKREEKRLEEEIRQKKFEEERNKLILTFKLMYFTTIIIEYFVLKWWLD